MAPVAPFAWCTLVASVATIISVAFACGETLFALGPQPVLRLGSPLEALGVMIASVYWFWVPLHRGRRPWQNSILLLVFFWLRAQFYTYKNSSDLLQVFPSG